MKLRLSIWSVVVVAVALTSVVLLSGDQAMASNMGFKMNKVIEPFLDTTRENWVALPYRHPYADMGNICTALGLTPNNSVSKVRRVNPLDGTQTSWACGELGTPPPLVTGVATHLQRAGLIVTNNVAAGGILVGSHQANPPGSISLKPLVAPVPIGHNYFSVPYHTTNVTSQDLCTDLGLPGTSGVSNGKVERRNAASGVTTSWDCQAIGTAPTLILGEAVRISFTGAAIDVPAGHPAHF